MKAIFSNMLMGSGVLLLVTAVVSTSPASYLYCLSKESSWLEAKTEEELESRLGPFYLKYDEPHREFEQSKEGEPAELQREVRYFIFGKEPLDVVFREDRSIQSITFSYD